MPSIKGTSSVPDSRALSKAIKSTKFPANFSTRVKLSKVNKPILTQWIEQRITTLLGFEDDIVQSTAVNLFLPSPPEDSGNQNTTVDPKTAQIDMAGFLGDEQAAKFASELWTLLIDAQQSPMGIPQKLLEEKKKELALAKQKAAEMQPQIPLRKPPPVAAAPRPPPPANHNNVAAARPVSPQHATENDRNRSREAERDNYRRDNERRRERDDDRGARSNHRDDRGGHYDSYGRRRDDTERRRERPPREEVHADDRRMSQSRSDRDRRDRDDDYRRDSRRDRDRDYHRRRDVEDDTRYRRDDRDRDHRSSRDHDRRRSGDRSRSRSRERRDRHRRRRDSSSSSSSQSDD
jgi:serine/arginine repetitive matrix protein 1